MANNISSYSMPPPSGSGKPGGKKGTTGVLKGLGALGVFGISALMRRKKEPKAPSASVFDSTVPPLISPPEPPAPEPIQIADGGGAQYTTVNKITGIQNVLNPYGAIPRPYGTVKMTPPLAAQFISVDSGQDNYGLGLFCLGFGELYVDPSSIKLGDRVLAASEYQLMPGTINDSAITLYTQDVLDQALSLTLAYNSAPYAVVKTSRSCVSVQVDFTCPNGVYSTSTTGSKSAATVNLDVFYRDATAAAPTSVVGQNSVTAGTNKTINVLSTTGITTGQFVTVSATGKQDIAYVTNVVVNTSITVARLNNAYTALGYTVAFNQWTKVVDTTAENPSVIITDNTFGQTKRSLKFDVPSFGAYNVLVVRTNQNVAGGDIASYTDLCKWTLLRTYGNYPSVNDLKDRAGNKVGISFLAVKLLATNSQNGSLSNLSCIVSSKLSAWNGASWAAPTITNNPAWILADILTGSANARYIPKSALDGNSFKELADYCDANARSFNYVYDAPTTVMQACREVASAARASLYLNDNNKYTCAIEKQKTQVVQYITPRNSWGFRWALETKVIPHGIKIQFVDQASGWVQAERVVYDDGYNADGSGGLTQATEFEQISLVGCTNASQAWKDGRYHLAVARLRRRRFWVYMDFEYAICSRFDLVKLSHDTVKIGLARGRVRSTTQDGSGNCLSVTLDEDCPMDISGSYVARFRLSDGSSVYAPVNKVAGYNSTLTFTTPIASGDPQPQPGDLFTFGLAGLESLDCIVDGIEPQPDGSARISFVEQAAGVYQAETGAIPAWESGITELPVVRQTVPVPIVDSIITDETALVRDVDGSYASRIQLDMKLPPTEIEYYESQFKRTDAITWSSSFYTTTNQGIIYITGVQDGQDYNVRIRQINRAGYKSDWTTLEGITVIGKTTLPPDVPAVDLVNNDNTLVIHYNASVGVTVPVDFAGFRIKWHAGANSNWESGTIATSLLTGNQFDLRQLPGGALTILVKAVDVAGNESANAKILLRNFGDPDTSNVILTIDHDPAFTLGTITNGAVAGGDLLANADSSIFWSASDSQTLWGANDSATFWSDRYLELTYEWEYTPDASLLPMGAQTPFLLVSLDAEAESYALQYRRGGSSNLFWDIAAGSDSLPFWGADDAETYFDAPGSYIACPGQIPLALEKYQFKFVGAPSASTRAKIKALANIIDVPDVVEYISDFVVSSGGSTLPISKTYRAITTVIASVQADALYPNAFVVVVADKATTGPRIQIFDKNGVQIAGKINSTVKGY